jgi:hypothetical protein
METSGDISVFFYDNNNIKYGLPIRPQLFNLKSNNIAKSGIYACTFCANTQQLEPTKAKCSVCSREEWVEAINTKRIV